MARKFIRWGFVSLAFSIFVMNCGYRRPPRMWQCQCQRVCLDKTGATENVQQRACGYTKSQATRYATNSCNRTSIPGCLRTACVCQSCLVSRSRYCRNRVNTIISDDSIDDWAPYDDDVVVYEEDEFVDPDDPAYQDEFTNDDLNNDDDDNSTDDNWDDGTDDSWDDTTNDSWDDTTDDTTDDNWDDSSDDNWDDDDD